jgi:adenosylmethionine-8-amino-7-oxononanoate aminotransferase
LTWKELDKRHLWHPFTPQQRWEREDPLVIVQGRGNYLIDDAGHRYLDGVSSLWTNVHGHDHPRIQEAIRAQLANVAHTTLLGLTHPAAITLAARLVGIAPWGLTRVFYSDSGSTATEVAVKMAFQAQQQRGHTQKTRFATLSDAYHGDTLGAVSVGAIPTFHQLFRPLLFESVALPAPRDPESAEEVACLTQALRLLDLHGPSLAALIVEPLVQGAAGMKMHSPGFLSTIIDKARAQGALIIADEVAVGFGRTGSMFAMEQVGRSPDLLCLAKGLTGGFLPLAATLASEAIYADFLGRPEDNRQFFHGHTYTGNPLACAAAIANLDLFEEQDVLARVHARGAQMELLVQSLLLSHPWVARYRRKGVLVGIDLDIPGGTPPDVGHRVCSAARRHGVILRPLGATLIFNPPLSIEPHEVALLVEATRLALDDVLQGGA